MLATAPLAAQTQRPERPYRGLFGGGAAAGAGHSISVNGSIGGGYDDNILLDQQGPGSSGNVARPVAGTLGSASASLSYAANLGRFSFGANAGSSTRYYPSQDRAFITAHSAGLGLQAPIGQRTSFTLSQSASYMPFTFVYVLPFTDDLTFDQFAPPPLDLVTSRGEFLSHSTSATLSRQFSRRLSGNASYAYSGSDSSLYGAPLSRHSGAGGLTFSLSQGLGLNFGYRRMEARSGAGGRSYSQDSVDAGINYQRALSFSRRTTLAFGTGSSAVSSGDRTQYRVTGAVNLNHEVGRTWLATAGYTRGVRFVETLLEPVFQDAVMAGFGGLVNQRVQVQTSVRGSVGQLGFSNRNNFDTYVASAGAAVAITQHVNFGLNYSIYRYQFNGDALLPPGVPAEVNRQSVRATISVWAPLLNTGRRANATR